MFIQLRGTHGSGKTTVALGLRDALIQMGGIATHVYDLVEGRDRVVAMRVTGLRKPVLLLGKYGDNACGGGDTLNWKGACDWAQEYIYQFASTNHILLEGSVMSINRRFNEIGVGLRRLGVSSRYLALDTPFDECVFRVLSRRRALYDQKRAQAEAAGKPPPAPPEPFDPETNLREKFVRVTRTQAHAASLGLHVETVTADLALPIRLYNTLKEDDHV
jgi:hypothetical protein